MCDFLIYCFLQAFSAICDNIITTRYDPLRPDNTRYDRFDPLRPATTRYGSLRFATVRYFSVLAVRFSRFGSHGSVRTVRFSRLGSHSWVRTVNFARFGFDAASADPPCEILRTTTMQSAAILSQVLPAIPIACSQLPIKRRNLHHRLAQAHSQSG